MYIKNFHQIVKLFLHLKHNNDSIVPLILSFRVLWRLTERQTTKGQRESAFFFINKNMERYLAVLIWVFRSDWCGKVNREVIWIWQSKKHCIAILSARIIISHPPGPVTRWFLKNSHEGLGGQKGSLPRLLMSARSPDNQNDDWWYTVSLIQPWPWSIIELYSD